MGLDTEPEAWSGAYSAFNRWRNQVAEAAGYTMTEMDIGWTKVMVPLISEEDYARYTGDIVYGDWAGVIPSDPLHYLFLHSDAEGMLTQGACAALGERLLEILPKFPVENDWAIAKTQKFADGCFECVRQNVDMQFQ